MENTEKKALLEKYIVCIIKNYNRIEMSLQLNNRIMIVRNGIVRNCKCFYHFDFEDFSIYSSFWSTKKQWKNSLINL